MKAKHLCSFVIIFLLLTGACWADETISFKVGYLSLNPDGTFAVNDGGISGTKIDFDDDLNFDDSEEFFAEVALNLGDFRLSAGYLPIDFSGRKDLSRTIFFNGQRYDINTVVSSDVEMDVYDLGLAWHILNIDDMPVRIQLGPEVSVKIVDADLEMNDLTTGLNESESAIIPVPTIGARARVGITDWLAIVGRAGYMKYSDNSFLDIDGQVEFSPLPMVGIFAGYRYMDIDVDESGVFIDATLDGPYAGLLARF